MSRKHKEGHGIDWENLTPKGRMIIQDFGKVLATTEGKRIFNWILLEVAGIYKSTFNPESKNTMQILEGMRSAGLQIYEPIRKLESERPSLHNDLTDHVIYNELAEKEENGRRETE